MIFPNWIIYRHLQNPQYNCIKRMLIMVNLSAHLNQKYQSVVKNYVKKAIFLYFR